METASVRSSVGNHFYDWVVQKDTRLATARDKSTTRGSWNWCAKYIGLASGIQNVSHCYGKFLAGLTRAEVTFYGSTAPSADFMHRMLNTVVEYVDPSLVFATPFAQQWKALCENFEHSVVVKYPQNDTALLGLCWNEYTKKISGQIVKNFTAREKWCLANCTLAADLPIDIVSSDYLCINY